MAWIYLSPHFDDVALSCGGLVWEQTRDGETVEIWTVCAGAIPRGELSPFAKELHTRWGTGPNAVAQRKMEDLTACTILGAGYRYFDIPDAIYRRSQDMGEHIYGDEAAIFDIPDRREEGTIALLTSQFIEMLPVGAQLVCPLALGDHVDHQLVRQAAERAHLALRYYPDYPYVIDNEPELESLERAGWKKTVYPIAPDALTAWVESVAAYGSQISSFWQNKDTMKKAIEDYSYRHQGICLWSPL